jgi:DNA-binding MarR family transcriptional regulator
MTTDTQLLREIRDLLQVIAEPALAKRDERLRQALLDVVGTSKAKAKAVLLMDGSRAQADIKKESGIDFGALSRCVKELRAAGLISKEDDKHPKLVIAIPANFFEAK